MRHILRSICQLLFRTYIRLLVIALNVGDNVTLRYLRTTLGIDLDNLATECSWYLYEFAPRSLDVAENVAFLILLADERLDSRCALAFA